MTLRAFHLFFIICAVLLSFFLAYWGTQEGRWTLALITGIIGAVLLAYGFWFVRKLQQGRT